MRKRFTEWGHCVGHQWSYDHIHEYMNIMRVNIEYFTGCRRIKQRRISFVPVNLRMILWKISTAISIKHRILATFNIKKKNLTACMPLSTRSVWKWYLSNRNQIINEYWRLSNHKSHQNNYRMVWHYKTSAIKKIIAFNWK